MNEQQKAKQAFDKIESTPPADWVRKMHEHFVQTGGYRDEDVKRIVGDPNRRVEVGGQDDVTAAFRSSK